MIFSKNGVKWLYQLNEDTNPWNPNSSDGGPFLPKEPIPLENDFACYDEKGILRLVLHRDGSFTIREKYAWNGCTPKFGFFDILIGTPDGVVHRETGKPKAYYATMIHDSLYQFIPVLPQDFPITRKVADKLFLELLERDEFILRWIYWLAVRVFGGFAIQGRRKVTRKTAGYIKVVLPKS